MSSLGVHFMEELKAKNNPDVWTSKKKLRILLSEIAEMSCQKAE